MRSMLLVAALAVASPARVVTQSSHITVHQLGPGLTVLMPDEGSGNALIAHGPDGALIVDTMDDSIAGEFLEVLAALGLDDVRYVLNTHWHQNHAGANGRLAPGATIVGPRRLRERLSAPQRLEFLVQRDYPALSADFLPTVTFADSVALHLNGYEVRVWHVRAHTDTDAIVYIPGARVVATGDLWSPGGPFLADLDTGGSLWGVEAVLADLLRLLPDDVVMVPGHGRLATVEELRQYHAGLSATLEFVRAAADAGHSLAELQAMARPPSVEAFVGRNSARVIEAAYRSPRTVD